jgi:hypothetical protein
MELKASSVILACGFSARTTAAITPKMDLYLGTVSISEPRLGFVGSVLGRGVFSNPQTIRIQADILMNHFMQPDICARSTAHMQRWIQSLPVDADGQLNGQN